MRDKMDSQTGNLLSSAYLNYSSSLMEANLVPEQMLADVLHLNVNVKD